MRFVRTGGWLRRGRFDRREADVSAAIAAGFDPVSASVVPSGESLLPVLFVLAVNGRLLVAVRETDPPITDRVLLAFAPWIAVGAALSALAGVLAVPPALVAAVRSPWVYVVAVTAAGTVWLLAANRDAERGDWSVPEVVGVSGVLVLAPIVGSVVALDHGTVSPVWGLFGFLFAGVLSLVVWSWLGERYPHVVARTGSIGLLVVYGHVLDGVTTVIGVDLLGLAEANAISRTILDVAAGLPVPDAFGVGWFFTLVKLLVALAVLRIVTDPLAHDPTRRRLLLAVVAAAGLGPGLHNVFLYFLL